MFETLRLRVQDLASRRAPYRDANQPSPARRESQRETMFAACGGKLTGKPDLVLPRKIVDYKTGSITEENEQGEEEVRASFVRQLRLYSFLVGESVGQWPDTAELVPLHGPAVAIDVDRAACAAEAATAIALLDSYNNLLTQGDLDKLANPSPAACKWCSFKLFCNPFWRAATPDWSGKLDGDAVEGVLAEPPRPLLSGLVFRIPLELTAGTARGSASIAPVRSTENSFVQILPPAKIRFVALRSRPDGSLTPTPRTVHALVSEVPQIAI